MHENVLREASEEVLKFTTVEMKTKTRDLTGFSKQWLLIQANYYTTPKHGMYLYICSYFLFTNCLDILTVVVFEENQSGL